MEQGEADDPPARNLRKNSGRHVVVDTNMATLGDKASKRKIRNKREDNATSTPSVKNWLSIEHQSKKHGQKKMNGTPTKCLTMG